MEVTLLGSIEYCDRRSLTLGPIADDFLAADPTIPCDILL